jgi:hypothetical protein
LRSPASRAYPPASANGRPIDGSVFAGVANAFRSPYLVNVSLFVLLFVVSSTFLYFQQAEIVKTSFADRGAQTAFLATIDLAVNILTFGVSERADRRVARRRRDLGAAASSKSIDITALPYHAAATPQSAVRDGVPSRRATLQRPRYL